MRTWGQSKFTFYCVCVWVNQVNQETGRVRDSLEKSKVEIITDFIKLNDEIPVCVPAKADDLQVLKLKISDSMSSYLTSVVQHLKEVNNDQQNFIIKALEARRICCSKDSTCNFANQNELLKVRLEESEKRILFLEKEAKDLMIRLAKL